MKRVSPCGTNEPDINRHCAHSFPAVAFTLGRRNWPQLQETYAQLASDMQVMVTIFKQFPLITKCFSTVTFYVEIVILQTPLSSQSKNSK